MKKPSSWKIIEDNLHSDCRIFEVRKQKFVRNSDHKKGEFFVLNSNDWVNVLALTKDDQLVMVRQYRYGTQSLSLEPPGGVIEKDEDPILAGQRELLEETGYKGESCEVIGSINPNSAIMSNRCFILMIPEVEKVTEVSFDPNEDLVTELVHLSKIEGLIRSQKITHSLALNAIFHLLLKLKKLPNF